ncbi:seg-like homing endonuclease GIY-YIG family [Klebsiella phage vB_KaeM_Merci]|nr:seg-like homing endonuclease GIY-YIG family [Klebsiella phage vB_KaeM_Merci]
MYYYTYKITNLLNSKIYISVHKTENLDKDCYMGSGKILKLAIEKYGITNFKKEIIKFHTSEEEMFKHESLIVNEEFVKSDNTYNLKIGGEGGFDYLNSSYWTLDKMTIRGRAGATAVCRKIKNDPEFKLKFSNKIKAGITPVIRKRITEGVKANIAKNGNPFLGKTHSSETKRKISDKLKLAQSGSKNSQFGTMWINNGIEAKKISKDSPIPEGWYKGRKLINK